MKYNNANTVNDIFKDIYEYTIDNYKDVDDFRSDLMKHGNIHGCISEILMDMDTQLIFHWETTELFDEFEDECNDWLRELGFKPWEIFLWKSQLIFTEKWCIILSIAFIIKH